jgi:hypothetical protein
MFSKNYREVRKLKAAMQGRDPRKGGRKRLKI